MLKDYHLFKKTVKSGSKSKTRYYYWFYDESGKQVQKVCKNCSSRWEAEQFISSLPDINQKSTKIKDIANGMYLPGSKHLMRREQMGQLNTENTLIESRRYLQRIINDFGDKNIQDLQVRDVMNLLWSLDYKSTWKNSYLKVLNEIYQQASWEGINVIKPVYPRFKNDYKKADIFTDDELNHLFDILNFRTESDYLFFLLTVSAGLRISETRGFRPCQLVADKNMVCIDGFMDKNNKFRNSYCKAASKDDPKWRVAIIPQDTMKKLMDFLTRNPRDPEDILFTYDGAPYRLEFTEDLLQEALVKAHIEKNGRKLTPHSLRYTYVTKMREFIDGETVKEMVGHTSIKMTDYYTRMGLTQTENRLLPFVDAADNLFRR